VYLYLILQRTDISQLYSCSISEVLFLRRISYGWKVCILDVVKLLIYPRICG